MCPGYVAVKPNSITLAGSQLVRSWSPTSFEPDSVMEFGFKYCYKCWEGRWQQSCGSHSIRGGQNRIAVRLKSLFALFLQFDLTVQWFSLTPVRLKFDSICIDLHVDDWIWSTDIWLPNGAAVEPLMLRIEMSSIDKLDKGYRLESRQVSLWRSNSSVSRK